MHENTGAWTPGAASDVADELAEAAIVTAAVQLWRVLGEHAAQEREEHEYRVA